MKLSPKDAARKLMDQYPSIPEEFDIDGDEVTAAEERGRQAAPIPMILYCPACGTQHVDAPEVETGWTNPPHRSHTCHGCEVIWRPADVATVGVAAIATQGKADTFDGSRPREQEIAALKRDLIKACDRGIAARQAGVREGIEMAAQVAAEAAIVDACSPTDRITRASRAGSIVAAIRALVEK